MCVSNQYRHQLALRSLSCHYMMAMVAGSQLKEDNCTQLSGALHVAHIKPVYWLFPVGSKVQDISYS